MVNDKKKGENKIKMSILETRCPQCGKVMGPEIFLGTVCGNCCRKNHEKVAGKIKTAKRKGKKIV